MNIRNFKIGTRLGLAFGIVLVLLIVTSVVGALKMAEIQRRLRNVVEVNNIEARQAVKMRAAVYESSIAARNVVLLTDMEQMKPQAARIKPLRDAFDAA